MKMMKKPSSSSRAKRLTRCIWEAKARATFPSGCSTSASGKASSRRAAILTQNLQLAHNGLVFLARQTPCSFLSLHGFPSQVSQAMLLPERLSIARVLVRRAGDPGGFPLQTPPNRWTSSADPMASHTRLAHLIGLLREMREQCLRCVRDGVPGTGASATKLPPDRAAAPRPPRGGRSY